MQVIEHQYLHFKNVLVYETDVSSIDRLAGIITEGLETLGLNLKGPVLFTIKGDKAEFLIPVDRILSDNRHYRFKSEFKLVNAVRVRHYGEFKNISIRLSALNTYIKEHSFHPITQPYFMVCDAETFVYDIFVGLSENVL